MGGTKRLMMPTTAATVIRSKGAFEREIIESGFYRESLGRSGAKARTHFAALTRP
jgi:hypothetical protein